MYIYMGIISSPVWTRHNRQLINPYDLIYALSIFILLIVFDLKQQQQRQDNYHCLLTIILL